MKKIIVALFTALVMASSLATAETTTAETPTWTLNVVDGEIRGLINQMAEITGKTFVIEPRVTGRITVISQVPMQEDEIYELFLTVLMTHGFTAIERDGIVRILNINDVKQTDGRVDFEPGVANQELITRVFEVRNTSVQELVAVLRPLVARYGHLGPVTNTNALIVSDHAANIERIEAIIKAIDQTGNDQIEVIQLNQAWVGNVIRLLENLLPDEVAAGGGRAGFGRLRLVADERSNRIIVKGEAQAIRRVRQLVATLDVPAPATSSSRVIFLNHADAETMASNLSGIAGTVLRESQEEGAPQASDVTILADKDLNALVVRAEPSVIAELESIIAQLDVPRAQVLIEAAIVEVNMSQTDRFGVQMGIGPGRNPNMPIAATSFSEGGRSLGQVASDLLTLDPSALVSGFNLGGFVQDEYSFGALVQAVQGQTNSNLLSTPSAMTLNNKEAYLLVGSNVPFRTTGTDASGNPFSSLSRQDVGTVLTVTPRIQNDNSIRLEVDLTVEDVAESVEGGVTTNKRQIKTEVLVMNEDTIVLGGLVKDNYRQVVTKVPVLGDLPVIGALFRARSEVSSKTNLMLFIRPTVVRSNANDISRVQYGRVWQLNFDGQDLMNNPPRFEELFSF